MSLSHWIRLLIFGKAPPFLTPPLLDLNLVINSVQNKKSKVQEIKEEVLKEGEGDNKVENKKEEAVEEKKDIEISEELQNANKIIEKEITN